MSCSSYCQGQQSRLEPGLLVEARVLRLKLAPPKSNNSGCLPEARSSNSFDTDSDGGSKSNNNYNHNNVDLGGWSFLQSLAINNNNNNITSLTKKDDNTTEKDNKAYNPPNFKRSPSMLSDKSLEMCTESLGSETGSDGSESSDEMCLVSSENVKDIEIRQMRPKLRETREMRRSASFPPPLTSISGSTNVQVRSHRDGGRLILKAVSVPSSEAYFHAERVDGRLRLHLVKDCSPSRTHNEEEQQQQHEEQVTNEKFVQVDENESSEAAAEDEEVNGNWDDENCGGEMGMEKLPRPSRYGCKESGSGNKRFVNNWEPFLVAT